jgi:hypothetical protein
VFFSISIRKGMSFFSFSLLCRDNEQSQRSLKIFNPFLQIFGVFTKKSKNRFSTVDKNNTCYAAENKFQKYKKFFSHPKKDYFVYLKNGQK